MSSRNAFSFLARAGVGFWLVLGLGWSVAGETSRELTKMKPAEFARLPAVDALIEIGEFDRELVAAAIFHETNRWRARLGLPAFRHHPKLDEAADVQATFGSLLTEVGHTNPLPSQARPLDRVLATGLNPLIVAENVALTPLLDAGESASIEVRGEGAGQKYFDPVSGRELSVHSYASFAARVLVQWMDSPGHRANIVSKELRMLGCGARLRRSVNGTYSLFSVQEFFTPESPHFR